MLSGLDPLTLEEGKEKPFLSEAHLEEDLLASDVWACPLGVGLPASLAPAWTNFYQVTPSRLLWLPCYSPMSRKPPLHCPRAPSLFFHLPSSGPVSFLSRAVTTLWAQPFQHLAESAVTLTSECFMSHLHH